MASLETILAGAILASLTIYVLTGGADFGGGVWDLLASGPRREAQRKAIRDAIGPIWEANHVWLILVIVLLFTAFPPAFATISTALHVPLVAMLLGVVLRGAAFTFRAYDTGEAARRWERVFAVASAVTPLTLGVCVGAVASGDVSVEQGRVTCGFFRPWLAPFPWVVGAMTLALFAFLAAVYLANEVGDDDLREDFRVRSLASAFVVGLSAHLALWLSVEGAPRIHSGLVSNRSAWVLQATTASVSIGAIVALWRRRLRLARALAVAQAALVVWDWGLAQFPYLVVPSHSIQDSAAPQATLRPVAWALALGALVLFPTFYYLLRVFKGRQVFELTDRRA